MPWAIPCLEKKFGPGRNNLSRYTCSDLVPLEMKRACTCEQQKKCCSLTLKSVPALDLQVHSSLPKRRWPRAHPTRSAQMYSCSQADPSRSDHRFVAMSFQLIKMQLLTSTWKKRLEMRQDRGPKKKGASNLISRGLQFQLQTKAKKKNDEHFDTKNKNTAAGGRNQKKHHGHQILLRSLSACEARIFLGWQDHDYLFLKCHQP